MVSEVQELQRKQGSIDAAIAQFHDWADRLRGNLKSTAFDEVLVNELVSRINIYDIEHIEVEFSCKDVFRTEWMSEWLGEPKEVV